MKRSAVLVACCAALLVLSSCATVPPPPSSRVVKTVGDDEFCAELTKIVEADIRAASKLSMVADDKDEVQSKLMQCMKLMQRAYDAQMAFAVASLEIYRTTKPKLYAEALNAYRMALQTQYRNDLESLRKHYSWCDEEEDDEPTGDAFLDAPGRNGNGAEVRFQIMQRVELREEMLKSRRSLVRKTIEERCSGDGYEFLTDSKLNDSAADGGLMSPRCRKLLSLFDHAEQCWDEYAKESGLSFYCPIRSWAGTDTYCMAYTELIYHLWNHHEAFLAELLGGFCRKDD